MTGRLKEESLKLIVEQLTNLGYWLLESISTYLPPFLFIFTYIFIYLLCLKMLFFEFTSKDTEREVYYLQIISIFIYYSIAKLFLGVMV